MYIYIFIYIYIYIDRCTYRYYIYTYIYVYIYYVIVFWWFESFCWKLITKKLFSFLFSLILSISGGNSKKKSFIFFTCHLTVLDCNFPCMSLNSFCDHNNKKNKIKKLQKWKILVLLGLNLFVCKGNHIFISCLSF